MIRSKRFANAVLVRVGLIGVSILLTRCAVIPAEPSIQSDSNEETSIPQPARSSAPNPAPTDSSTPSLLAPPPTPDQPILPLAEPEAATNLQSMVECERPGKPVARLSWTPAEKPGTMQRVDVTIYSFEEGQFDSSETLPPDQSSLVWIIRTGQAIHDWRVLTLQEEGWVPSVTAGFEGPTCVGKEEPTPTQEIIR